MNNTWTEANRPRKRTARSWKTSRAESIRTTSSTRIFWKRCRRHTEQLEKSRKYEDPRLSFSTPEFKEAQRKFQQRFSVNFDRPIEYGMVKKYPWSTPTLQRLEVPVDSGWEPVPLGRERKPILKEGVNMEPSEQFKKMTKGVVNATHSITRADLTERKREGRKEGADEGRKEGRRRERVKIGIQKMYNFSCALLFLLLLLHYYLPLRRYRRLMTTAMIPRLSLLNFRRDRY